jgi:amino acid transporter
MFLDYLVIPLISAIIPALAIQRLLPFVPFPVLTFLILAGMTALNLQGIRATARANTLLLVVTSIAVGVFLILAIRYLVLKAGWGSVLSMKPMYNAATFHPGHILGGISLAALTYIGFDGLTTLAEDSLNPKRDMVLATVLVVLVTGLLSGVELYFLHLVLPDWKMAADPNTAYLDVMQIVGSAAFFTVFLVVMSVSQFGAGFSVQVNAARLLYATRIRRISCEISSEMPRIEVFVQVNAARLLYAMGRDNVLPRTLFGYLSPRRQNPTRNIILVGLLAFLGTVFVPFDNACDLLNFGAFLGFMGVNLATLWTYYVRPAAGHCRNFLWDALTPGLGFLLCLVFWIGLPSLAKLVGAAWLFVGMAYCAYKTRGFRDRPLTIDFSES